MGVRRDWHAAHSVVRKEAECRVCGSITGLDPAHLWPRSLGGDESEDNIVALCRWHHGMFDSGDLDLGPYLETAEKLRVVELAETRGRRDGVEAAHRRLFPTAHKGLAA